jgi:hypothetical protein
MAGDAEATANTSGWLCHDNEGGTHREPKLAKHHAAVTALFLPTPDPLTADVAGPAFS